ncbi:MAG TPA: PaaX family transcriptional regulator C-terminal domain-containing protein [Pseudonocardia sp.]|uniref:PaaX family transcriptional regulator n=1 Tax=Pseudonocardia sp. TaxID=60912 RepID=UPI002F41BE55
MGEGIPGIGPEGGDGEIDGAPDASGPLRPAGAGSARSLLLTILGELVLPHREPVWTSTLLYVLKGLGLEEQTARQAIARGAGAGWIAGDKQGREVRWTLTDAGRQVIADGSHRVHAVRTPEPWDGDWLVLLVTIPQARKTVRKRLYSALSWAGFGNPAAGVWVSPHPERAKEVARIIHDLELRDSAVGFVGPTLSVGMSEEEIVRRAWDLDDLAAQYQELIERFADQTPGPGDESLFTLVNLVNEWQRFPFLDPQLPEELLPGWIGRRAVELFVSRRRAWVGAARERWRELAEATAPAGQDA